MSDSDHSDLISEFCKVTGADQLRARHFLEASGWDSNIAISNFFEGDDESEMIEGAYASPGSPTPGHLPPSSTNRSSNFATLDAYRDENSQAEEEGQAFYAGGSERSGQQVLGPSKKKSIVEDLFKSIREYSVEAEPNSDKQKAKSKAFGGAGHVLGADPQTSATVRPAAEARTPIDISLRFWERGFTVGDGPLREYADPANKEFLDAVRKGEIPAELRHKGHEIHINVEDKSHEEYVPKKPARQAFAGAGFRLGNITPVVTAASATPDVKDVAGAQDSLKVDKSKPVTSLQIRLVDGSRLVMQANHFHTIGDVRQFIVHARPEYGAYEFILMSSFPPKELVDDAATLEAENLLNSVIVQKLKAQS